MLVQPVEHRYQCTQIETVPEGERSLTQPVVRVATTPVVPEAQRDRGEIRSLLPHGLARIASNLLTRYVLIASTRGLWVTNLSAIDDYLAPFGDVVEDAYLIGPFLPAAQIPLVAVTGFRGRAAVCVCGCDGPEGALTLASAAKLETLAAAF